jgi:endonuclease YncB( thermonuclease family)
MKVLNADVFVIDGQHIRLAEAYAPQPVPDARCWAEAVAAKLASQQVRSLVDDAQDVSFRPTGQRDEYNRIVARVSLDAVDLSRTLQDAGLAATKAEGRFEWCEPLSKKTPGAPSLNSLMDFSR